MIASAVGNEMLRNAMEAQRYSDSEKTAAASEAKWFREKELVLRVAKVPWENVRENAQRALNLMPASVLLQLHMHGQS